MVILQGTWWKARGWLTCDLCNSSSVCVCVCVWGGGGGGPTCQPHVFSTICHNQSQKVKRVVFKWVTTRKVKIPTIKVYELGDCSVRWYTLLYCAVLYDVSHFYRCRSILLRYAKFCFSFGYMFFELIFVSSFGEYMFNSWGAWWRSG
jgi:hypothetical protein